MNISTANDLFAAARRGSREFLGVLDGVPTVMVEVRTGDVELAAVAPAFPSVVVAVARDHPAAPAPVGADIALCPVGPSAAPAGWVAVADLDAELRHLTERVRHAPEPAVILAQLLRTSDQLDTERALMAESLAYSVLQSGAAFNAWLRDRRRGPPQVRQEPDDPVLVERRDGTLIITLNRPHVRNAANVALRDSLASVLVDAITDPGVLTVELHGAGPDFSSGGDLDEFGSMTDPTLAHVIRTVRSPALLLARLESRVTAHLHGACVGAGIELAAFAGRVVASPEARCQLPELGLGLVPGSGGTVSITRRIGRQRTAWLALGGSAISAETAAMWGLVDEVVPDR